MPTIDTSGCSLELLNEYRTRLIADVVTGKLDVRDIVLPEMEGDDLGNIDVSGDEPDEEDADL